MEKTEQKQTFLRTRRFLIKPARPRRRSREEQGMPKNLTFHRKMAEISENLLRYIHVSPVIFRSLSPSYYWKASGQYTQEAMID
jgi:hypothetical protein